MNFIEKILSKNPLNKAKNILNAWKLVVWKNPRIERIAHMRAAVCGTCEYNVWSTCKACGCPIVSKARDLTENCPKDKWFKNPDLLNDRQLDFTEKHVTQYVEYLKENKPIPFHQWQKEYKKNA